MIVCNRADKIELWCVIEIEYALILFTQLNCIDGGNSCQFLPQKILNVAVQHTVPEKDKKCILIHRSKKTYRSKMLKITI